MRNQKIAELLHQYFELGVAEGREGRNHDTEAGDAQRVLSEIEAEIAALSAAEPLKTAFEVASKHIPEARVSLLSRAIRHGLNDYGWKNFGTLPEVLMGYIVQAERAEAEAHPKQPAPSVAVKALEAHVLEDFTHLTKDQAVSGPYIVKRIQERFKSYALSAQVQDVATAAEFADRMFKLHGFMLSEEYRGNPAVTITFPNGEERNQFYSAIVELSTHKTPPAPAKQEG